MQKLVFTLCALFFFCTVILSAQELTLNQKADGYRGIWYKNQPLDNVYKFKYSGGLGTYCAKHQPFAVYCPEVNKTFFCYGGVDENYHERFDLAKGGIDGNKVENALYHMVSYYDHNTGKVPRPTLLLDKNTHDAHDNPVISVDDKGYIWIFSTSHGTSRPSYIHRSSKPYDIEKFDLIEPVYLSEGEEKPLNNFSYLQAWHVPEKGFICFFTKYNAPAKRTNYFMSSKDGVHWSEWTRLAAIDEGHYQISALGEGVAGAAFNYHPQGQGLNWRTNLYYMETPDFGRSWRAADYSTLELPLEKPDNAALVYDYQAEGLKVYLKDIRYDKNNRPLILFITSKGHRSGPENDPRTWRLARWTGKKWAINAITTSDNNYDMGSLWINEDGSLQIIAPTETGPQAYNPGGEIALWISKDQGASWTKQKNMTSGSPLNHTYVRRPVNAHPAFFGLWADGNGRQPSKSNLYFCDQNGQVFKLPERMKGKAFARPKKVRAK